jgi:hypothetical protein
MREHAGTDGRLLQTGVDIACRLGQLAARRHFDVGAACIDRSNDAACRHVQHVAFGHDLAVEPDHAAAGQQHVTA